jgi:preprotein translocase subunit YajC
MKGLFFVVLALLTASFPLLADQPEALPSPDQGFMQTLIMVGVALLFFYFILWRPEQKRRKALESQRDAMKKGDKVVAMGVVGTIHKIKENTVVVCTGDDSKIEFLKGAITEVTSPSQTVGPTVVKEG